MVSGDPLWHGGRGEVGGEGGGTPFPPPLLLPCPRHKLARLPEASFQLPSLTCPTCPLSSFLSTLSLCLLNHSPWYINNIYARQCHVDVLKVFQNFHITFYKTFAYPLEGG